MHMYASKYFLRASPALEEKVCASPEGVSERVLKTHYFEEKSVPHRYQSAGFHK